MSSPCTTTQLVLLCVLLFLATLTVATTESSRHRVLFGPLVDVETLSVPAQLSNHPFLVSLETTRSLTIPSLREGTSSFHLYDQFDPLWAELLLLENQNQPSSPSSSSSTSPNDTPKSEAKRLREISYSSCGGRFRKGWMATNASTVSFHRVVRSLQSHATCEFATVSVCGEGNRSVQESQRTFARVAEKLSSVTSTPLRLTGAALRRPLTHLRASSDGSHWCALANSPSGPLCTQHLAPLLADHEHSSHSILRPFIPSYTLVLGTVFHHLSVKGTQEVHPNGTTTLTVVQRLSFVLTKPQEHDEWNAHVEGFQHRGVSLPPNTVMEPMDEATSGGVVRPVAHSPVKLLWSYQQSSDAVGELSVTATVSKSFVSQGGYDVALFFPLALARPVLHTVQGGTVRSSVLDEAFQTQVVVVRLPIGAGEGEGALSSRLTIQVEHSFISLSELPPDAHKRYPLLAPVLRWWFPCRRLTEHEVEMDHTSAQQLWFPAPNALQKTLCVAFTRGPADGATGLSTAVPDSAMIFNALTLGLLPCALLIGSVLKYTGRYALI